MSILSDGTNAKTLKSDLSNIVKEFLEDYEKALTGIVYLAPASISGKNVCGSSSPACRLACLYSAGRGRMSNVQKGRLRKTMLFLKNMFFFSRFCFFLAKIRFLAKSATMARRAY